MTRFIMKKLISIITFLLFFATSFHSYSISSPPPPTDGVDWILKLRSPDGKVKYATGYEKYPDTFNNLVEIFDELLGNKYDPDNKFFNYDEEKEE